MLIRIEINIQYLEEIVSNKHKLYCCLLVDHKQTHTHTLKFYFHFNHLIEKCLCLN